ncbi:hypothetical protein AB0A77_37980 [Streptomyces varsoviensis]|uniref:hypothetical protein n=1 Tax=Streptomyces varsoviensis TaxID=67373 RepID=UPI0034040362
MVIVSPYTIEHSAQCPPVDPRSKTRLDCRRCDRTREYGPYWIDGEKPVTCGTCGAVDVRTPADPRFAGYAGHHSRPENWRSACSGEYLAHGRATAERSTEPGWMPLAHVRLGDVITQRDNWGKWDDPAMVVDIEEGEASPGHPRIFVRWLSDNPHHGGGVWGMWAAPGTPVLLVEAATVEPPAAHVNVYYSNAISRRSQVYSRCYRTDAAAQADIREFWPYNNTRSTVSRCWCRRNELR